METTFSSSFFNLLKGKNLNPTNTGKNAPNRTQIYQAVISDILTSSKSDEHICYFAYQKKNQKPEFVFWILKLKTKEGIIE
jgi:hypothetical protein